MVEKTIAEIKATEEKAQQIIEIAEKNRFLTLSHSRKKAETLLVEAEKAARIEAQKLIEHAKNEATKEKELIERQNSEAIATLRQQVAPEIEEAKRLCR